MIRAVVDGRAIQLPEGLSILDAVRRAGVQLPALCHDTRFPPSGACRSCLVQVDGMTRPVTACAMTVSDGMAIETSTTDLVSYRRSLLELLARHYPGGTARRFPELPFHRVLHAYGLTEGLVDRPGPSSRDNSHPYLSIDLSRCIKCWRCVRICDEVQGESVWHVRGRGLESHVVVAGRNLRESPCVACGACADTCPTGAISDRPLASTAPPSQWTRTVCPYCGVGCELSVGTREDRITAVRPVLDAPVNKGHLCVKGRYAFDFVAAPDRITEPMLRDGTRWRRVAWAEARAHVVERLRGIVRQSGPDSVGLLGSARATNEDNYVTQKFARAVIGTHNVDCCARVCHAPSAVALKAAFGMGLATNSFDDIERAGALLVCGANVTESHPVVGARIRQAARRGAHLIVIDPRAIELSEDADCHLAVRPGTTIAALNAMAQTIVEDGLVDREFIERRTSGFEDWLEFIRTWTPERAADVCGVDADAIRRAARLYGGRRPAMSVHGLGLTEHTQGVDGVTTLINLALLTGNVGVPGAGVNPLRGQNNVQGAAHMGCDPGLLPGSMTIEAGREAFERVCGVPLPTAPGLRLPEMMQAAVDGRLKALWSIGYDVLLTNPCASETARALRALDLLIVQDLFLTETARELATVFLPACSSFEKDGTFMNAERRIQRVRAALRPQGSSKPDWQILSEVARAMGGRGFGFSGPEAIWNEVRDLCDGARGMTYARLEIAGLQWPCPSEDHPGTAILHASTFGAGPRAVLRRIDYVPSPEQVTPDYPFRLITGRTLYAFNAGTMTGRTRNRELRPFDLLDMHPEDAARLGVRDGETVRLTSRYGSASLPVRLNARVASGQLFATFHTPEVFLNAVTSTHLDAASGTPEYKLTAVRIDRVI